MNLRSMQLEIARLCANERRLTERLGACTSTQQRSVQTLEQRVQSLEAELGAARAEAASLHQEYESYKVGRASLIQHY